MEFMDRALADVSRIPMSNEACPDIALCVKPEWLEKILRSVKSLELRATRGRFESTSTLESFEPDHEGVSRKTHPLSSKDLEER